MAVENNRTGKDGAQRAQAGSATARAFPNLTQFQQEVASEIGIDLSRLQPQQEQVRQWEQSTHSRSSRSR